MNMTSKIALILKITQEEPERESLKTYLYPGLKRCESELSDLTIKYEVSPIKNFETEYKRVNMGEEGTWRDFFRMDHLDAEIKSIRAASGDIR